MALQSDESIEISLPITEISLGGDDVGLEYLKQKQSNWCWAACMEMVIRQVPLEITQCQMANLACGETGCCSVPGSYICNKTLDVNNRNGKPDIKSEWQRHGYDSVYRESALAFSTVQNEINAGRPIEIGLLWTGGGGHAMLIDGWDVIDGERIVIIMDPSIVEGSRRPVLFDELQVAFGRGTLEWYWTGIKRRD